MEKDTEELMNELKLAKGLGEFIEENTDEFEELPLTDMLAEMLRKYDKNRIDVIKAARLDFTYGYQIFDGKNLCFKVFLIPHVISRGQYIGNFHVFDT